MNNGPKILLLDIETKPIISYTWGLFDQNVGLNQIKEDWSIIAWSAKWLGSKDIIYKDSRNQKDLNNDAPILRPLWHLLDEADIVITQNGKAFDIKKINARFLINGFKPPSPYQQLDTKLMAKKHFGFTSNKLEYMTSKLNEKYKKMVKRKFSGFDLWLGCMAGNLSAWKEMEKYNKLDVFSLEELYNKLAPWGNNLNFNVYTGKDFVCSCGSKKVHGHGIRVTQTASYPRYRCDDCGLYYRGPVNTAKKGMLKKIV